MLQHLQRMDDPCVLVDVARSGVLGAGRLDLDCALVLLPTLASLLSSTFEEYALAAMQALTQLLDAFGQLVQSTRALAQDRVGVDLSAEARQQKCQAFFRHLEGMQPTLQLLAGSTGGLRQPAAALLDSMRSHLRL